MKFQILKFKMKFEVTYKINCEGFAAKSNSANKVHDVFFHKNMVKRFSEHVKI